MVAANNAPMVHSTFSARFSGSKRQSISKKIRPQRNVQAPSRFANIVEFTSPSDDVSNSLSRRGIAGDQATRETIQKEFQNLVTSMSISREQSRPSLTTFRENDTTERIGGLIAHTTRVLNCGDESPTNDKSTTDLPLIHGQHVSLSSSNTHKQQTSEKNCRGNDCRDARDLLISEPAIAKIQKKNMELNGNCVNEDGKHSLNNDEKEEQLIIQNNQLKTLRPSDNGDDNHGCAPHSLERKIVPSLLQCRTRKSDQVCQKAIIVCGALCSINFIFSCVLQYFLLDISP